uniref:Peptide methionine sulfoxide reductase MsrA n=1 Tax=Roseihalotalea indica TaxID=2867963 RepID=A0AA49GMU1_9BACT|nr:peptide-methionine (S)-S-oxide reductase MsrA [Tunicatimonas sp. TK19036]
MNKAILIISFIFLAVYCTAPSQEANSAEGYTVAPASLTEAEKQGLDTATFAGGCFWCTEAVFERVKGVKSVVSGYSGGEQANPTYEQVGAGQTDHAESIQIYYDPEVITYQKLLDVFFHTHDPTQLNRQGPDVGKQYRSVVFYQNEEQKVLAEEYMKKLSESGEYKKPIVTQLVPYQKFWMAEDYHQDYYEHNPGNPYIQSVTKPKVKKFEKQYSELLKDGVAS